MPLDLIISGSRIRIYIDMFNTVVGVVDNYSRLPLVKTITFSVLAFLNTPHLVRLQVPVVRQMIAITLALGIHFYILSDDISTLVNICYYRYFSQIHVRVCLHYQCNEGAQFSLCMSSEHAAPSVARVWNCIVIGPKQSNPVISDYEC